MATITNDFMLQLTAAMPMKQIDIGGKPYLQRYYAGTTHDDHDIWIHRFMSGDGERHLHNHPFNARAMVLCGGYREEMPGGMRFRQPTRFAESLGREWLECMHMRSKSWLGELIKESRPITVFDWHRITSVGPGTWTIFMVGPERLPMWFFRNDAGQLEPMVPSARDWWKGYGPRQVEVLHG